MSADERPPLLFLHGIFSQPALMSGWVERFERAGYECHVPVLPGRCPSDPNVLRKAGVAEFFAAARAARAELDNAPVVVGHSFGGLLAQQLAATTETRALVLLASIPPGILWTQPRSLPHLLPLLPAILAGRPILPSHRTLREVPFSTLPADEQDDLIDAMVPDSGRVFRSMTFGTPAVRVVRGAVACPVLCISGTADRNVSQAIARRIARRYGAEHIVYDDAPHWIVAESLADKIATRVIDWLRDVGAPPADTPPATVRR
jgi:pimeloyl-ACP methyl ester carboxylesterase